MCPATMLFNRPIRGLLPQVNREPIDINNDDAQYKALKAHQNKYIKAMRLTKTHNLFLQDLQ